MKRSINSSTLQRKSMSRLNLRASRCRSLIRRPTTNYGCQSWRVKSCLWVVRRVQTRILAMLETLLQSRWMPIVCRCQSSRLLTRHETHCWSKTQRHRTEGKMKSPTIAIHCLTNVQTVVILLCQNWQATQSQKRSWQAKAGTIKSQKARNQKGGNTTVPSNSWKTKSFESSKCYKASRTKKYWIRSKKNSGSSSSQRLSRPSSNPQFSPNR